jgi:uracil-DNA glycosylase family 4
VSGAVLPHPATGEPFPSPVPPGTGWPGDPADGETPVARTAAQVRRLAARAELDQLDARISVCRACPRLVAWREEVAAVKRAAFAHEEYWGRPLPGFGDPDARIIVLGLAPAAHGGNRTGRIFTGDRSGDWLFAALWRVGLANQPESVSREDGLTLSDCFVAAAVRCAPPANRPSPCERDHCLPYFARELELLARARVIVCLGGFAWDAALRVLRDQGAEVPRPRPRFGHGTEVSTGGFTLLGCYHVSQQNTFTGRLTEPMLDAVFARARELAGT